MSQATPAPAPVMARHAGGLAPSPEEVAAMERQNRTAFATLQIDCRDLFAKVQERIRAEFPHQLHYHGPSTGLTLRVERVEHWVVSLPMVTAWEALVALRGDLLAMLYDYSTAALRTLLDNGGDGSEGRTAAAAREVALHHAALSRPRVTPAELVAQFAARGVVIADGGDGNLHVSPAGALTEADRALLREHKAAILAAFNKAELV